jgi:flagellar hook-associated protein 1 FlgK
MDAVGQNISNVNTPGYARRQVAFEEIPQGLDGSAGGVRVEAITGARDTFTQQRLLNTQPLQSAQKMIADLTTSAQSVLGAPGKSLDNDLSSFFDAWSQLASNPTSGSARQSVVVQAQTVGQSFQRVSDQLSAVKTQAQAEVESTVTDIDTLADRIASLNTSLSAVGGSSSIQGQTIVDQLYAAINELSQDLNVSVLAQSDGTLNISYAGGRALVVGAKSYGLSLSPGSGNLTILDADGADVTSAFTDGKLGASLRVRDTIVPGYLNQLDTLAYNFVQQVNTVHAGGYDLNGTAGGDFFSPIASVSGAATAVTVDSSIAADPTTIAAAGTTVSGDNQNARAMTNLANTPVIGASTFAQSWANLVYQVGQDTKTAQDAQQTYSSVVSQIQALNDSVSAVSLNEEAATLVKFQRGYQANAQFFAAINQTIGALFAALQTT